jgi:AraC-like DNA-binding protein
MKDLRSDLAKMINRYSPSDGLHESPLPGIHCIKKSHPFRHAKQHWRPALYLFVQGTKEIILGREVLRCTEMNYAASPIDLPISGRVVGATPENPFLCLKIDFDSLILNEVTAQLEKVSPLVAETPSRALFIGKMSDSMLEAALRLTKLFRSPEDASVLGPLAIKEIFYHLLKGLEGLAIRQFLRAGSKMQKVSKAIYQLRSELTEELDIASLAKAASMSRSAFFKHFKEVTAMSPIQYQKRLRLLEARRLMTDEGETAEGSAFKVGYNSASQFSREYSRMFGNSPLRDTVKIKNRGSPRTTDLEM